MNYGFVNQLDLIRFNYNSARDTFIHKTYIIFYENKILVDFLGDDDTETLDIVGVYRKTRGKETLLKINPYYYEDFSVKLTLLKLKNVRFSCDVYLEKL